jgi:hypothetical protein
MSISTDLLKADRVGVRDLKEHLSRKLLTKALVITDRGIPISVNLPYSDMLELTDIIDELLDSRTVADVFSARKAIRHGAKGVDVSLLFGKMRARRK